MVKLVPLPDDVLKELADRARSYFKLDLTYVGAAVALITALKIERPLVFETIGNAAQVAHWLFVLMVFDTFAGVWISDEWTDVKRGRAPSGVRSTIALWLSRLQPIAHCFFIIMVLTTVVGRSEGRVYGLSVYRAEATLQNDIESFAVTHKRYPSSISDLQQDDPTVSDVLSKLEEEPFSYETVGDHDYRLTFKRGKWHYKDEVATHELQLQQIIEELEKTDPLTP